MAKTHLSLSHDAAPDERADRLHGHGPRPACLHGRRLDRRALRRHADDARLRREACGGQRRHRRRGAHCRPLLRSTPTSSRKAGASSRPPAASACRCGCSAASRCGCAPPASRPRSQREYKDLDFATTKKAVGDAQTAPARPRLRAAHRLQHDERARSGCSSSTTRTAGRSTCSSARSGCATRSRSSGGSTCSERHRPARRAAAHEAADHRAEREGRARRGRALPRARRDRRRRRHQRRADRRALRRRLGPLADDHAEPRLGRGAPRQLRRRPRRASPPGCPRLQERIEASRSRAAGGCATRSASESVGTSCLRRSAGSDLCGDVVRWRLNAALLRDRRPRLGDVLAEVPERRRALQGRRARARRRHDGQGARPRDRRRRRQLARDAAREPRRR